MSGRRLPELETVLSILPSRTPCPLAGAVEVAGEEEGEVAVMFRSRQEWCQWYRFRHLRRKLKPLEQGQAPRSEQRVLALSIASYPP